MSLLKDELELGIEEAELAAQKSLAKFPPFLRWLLIFGLVAIIPSYIIAKQVSLKLWEKNYSQYALVAKSSFENPKPIKEAVVSVTTLGQGIYSAVAILENENLDLSLDNIPYKFNFYNEKNELVHSESDKFFLLPNQKKYILAPKFTTEEKLKSAYLELPKDLAWQKKLQLPKVALTASQPRTFQQTSPFGFAVEGTYANDSPYQLKKVRLIFLLYNAENKLVGLNQRDDFSLAPHERRSYKQIWPGVSSQNITKVLVYPETNTLDPLNLSLPDQKTGPESDLSRPEAQPY